jgi:uncharacterized membrane protein YjfL (UPF0719 family)
MNWMSLLNSVVYSVLGLVVFCVGFIVIDKFTPYNLWEQLVKERNLALAVVIGCASIGICIIVAAAIHG